MKKIAVKLMSVFAASALLLSGCSSDKGSIFQNGDNNNEKPSGGISQNTAAGNQGQAGNNASAGNAEKTENSGSGGIENSTLPLSIKVNGSSYLPDTGGSGIGYASANGVTYVIFAGVNGNDGTVIAVTMVDQLVYKGSTVSQSSFGQNAAVEVLMFNTDTQVMSTGTTIDSTSESYIENAAFEIKEYSSGNRKLQITLKGDFHGGGESYSFNASGTAEYSNELEQELSKGSQVSSGNSNSCYLCKGSGVCYYCNGKGIVYTTRGQVTCVSCDGSTLCKVCHGRGTL